MGVPTSISSFPLPDGARLNLAADYMADRTGQTYDGPLLPDEFIETGPPADRSAAALNADPVVQAALRWLSEQYGCR
jgi:carboxyl-terminal processing protease